MSDKERIIQSIKDRKIKTLEALHLQKNSNKRMILVLESQLKVYNELLEFINVELEASESE